MPRPKCWSSRVEALRKTTLTRWPDGVVCVSVQPVAALTDATLTSPRSTRLITTDPADPAGKVAVAPIAGGVPLVFVDGSQVRRVWTVPEVVEAKDGAVVSAVQTATVPTTRAMRRIIGVCLSPACTGE